MTSDEKKIINEVINAIEKSSNDCKFILHHNNEEDEKYLQSEAEKLFCHNI